jgi:hypothetical protein
MTVSGAQADEAVRAICRRRKVATTNEPWKQTSSPWNEEASPSCSPADSAGEGVSAQLISRKSTPSKVRERTLESAIAGSRNATGERLPRRSPI